MSVPQAVTSSVAGDRRWAGAPTGASAGLRLTLDPLRITLALLLIVNVSRVHQVIGIVGKLRPALLLVAFGGLYAFLNPKKLGRFGTAMRTYPARVIIGLGLMACLSAPFGISLGASAAYILRDYSKVLFATLLVLVSIRGVRDLYTYMWAFAIATGILGFLALFVMRMSATAGGLMRISDSDLSYDANDTGCVLVVGIVVTLLAYQVSGKLGKLVCAGILLMAGMALAKTGSRGAFVGLVAVGGLLLVAMHQIPVAKRVGFVVVVLLGLAIAAPEGYWKQMESILRPTEDYNWSSPTGRRQVMKRGIGYMIRNPVTGIGIGNFPRAEGMISERAQDFRPGMSGIKWSAAHNSFLQTAAEMGVPGFMLFVMLVLGSGWVLFRIRRNLPRAWEAGDPDARFLYASTLYLPNAMLGFAVAGFFVSFAYLDLVYMLSVLIAGTIVCIDLRRRQQAAPQMLVASREPTVLVAPTGRRVRGFVPRRMRR